MSNKELFNEICRTAYSSVYWSRKSREAYGYKKEYGAMVEDSLFLSLFDGKEIVGSIEMEEKLGRRIAVKELLPTPLSCYYFLFCSPDVHEDEETREKLLVFKEMIEKSIKMNEEKAVRWEQGRREPYPVSLFLTSFEDGQMKEETINVNL